MAKPSAKPEPPAKGPKKTGPVKESGGAYVAVDVDKAAAQGEAAMKKGMKKGMKKKGAIRGKA